MAQQSKEARLKSDNDRLRAQLKDREARIAALEHPDARIKVLLAETKVAAESKFVRQRAADADMIIREAVEEASAEMASLHGQIEKIFENLSRVTADFSDDTTSPEDLLPETVAKVEQKIALFESELESLRAERDNIVAINAELRGELDHVKGQFNMVMEALKEIEDEGTLGSKTTARVLEHMPEGWQDTPLNELKKDPAKARQLWVVFVDLFLWMHGELLAEVAKQNREFKREQAAMQGGQQEAVVDDASEATVAQPDPEPTARPTWKERISRLFASTGS